MLQSHQLFIRLQAKNLFWVSAKPAFPKHTHTLAWLEDYAVNRQRFDRISLLNKLNRFLGSPQVNVFFLFLCLHHKHMGTEEYMWCLLMFLSISVSLFFSSVFPAEPLLHLTSVFVPVLLRLFPASEYVLRPFEVQRCSEHERRQCPLNPHVLVLLNARLFPSDCPSLTAPGVFELWLICLYTDLNYVALLK